VFGAGGEKKKRNPASSENEVNGFPFGAWVQVPVALPLLLDLVAVSSWPLSSAGFAW
jgi:hypothetical protein